VQWKNLVYRTAFTRTFFLDLSTALPTIASLIVTEASSLRPTLQWFLDDSTATDLGNFGVFEVALWNGEGGEGPYYDSDRSLEWFIITPDLASGQFRFPELPPQVVGIVEDFSFLMAPVYASLNDADWLEWPAIVGAPGMNPEEWTNNRGVNEELPQPSADDPRSFRRSSWYRYDDD